MVFFLFAITVCVCVCICITDVIMKRKSTTIHVVCIDYWLMPISFFISSFLVVIVFSCLILCNISWISCRPGFWILSGWLKILDCSVSDYGFIDPDKQLDPTADSDAADVVANSFSLLFLIWLVLVVFVERMEGNKFSRHRRISDRRELWWWYNWGNK